MHQAILSILSIVFKTRELMYILKPSVHAFQFFLLYSTLIFVNNKHSLLILSILSIVFCRHQILGACTVALFPFNSFYCIRKKWLRYYVDGFKKYLSILSIVFSMHEKVVVKMSVFTFNSFYCIPDADNVTLFGVVVSDLSILSIVFGL